MSDSSPAAYSVYCKSTSQGSHTKIMSDSSPAAYSAYCKSTSQIVTQRSCETELSRKLIYDLIPSEL